MIPGPELDAAVLRILGWRLVTFEQGSSAWKKPDGKFHEFAPVLSTDHNGHEALRLCGLWLDEHTQLWEVKSERGGFVSVGFMSVGMRQGSWWPIKGTRAEAICRLVLAIHEQETTNQPRAT